MRPVIHIYAMRTWGELGNLLAAKTLAGLLREQIPEAAVEVFEAESFLPAFFEAGEKISHISLTSRTAEERRERYLSLMRQLERVFPPDFEVSRDAFRQKELAALAAHLRAAQPAVVIGTKGVISRVCLAAEGIAQTGATVVNFITNHGLILLPIHRSTHIPLQLVQFDEGRDWLVGRYGCAGSSVEVVGPMVAGHALSREIATGAVPADTSGNGDNASPETPRVVIFCNRGGEEYLALMQFIADRYPETDLTLIAYNNSRVLDAAARMREASGRHRWRLYDRLTQTEYFREISLLSGSRYPMIVTKTGPNTVLEAVFFGVPVLLLDSGLPMEEWVMPWVQRHGLGRAVRTGAELLTAAEDWLGAPGQIADYRERVVAFRDEHLNRTDNASRIAGPIRLIFEQLIQQDPAMRAKTAL